MQCQKVIKMNLLNTFRQSLFTKGLIHLPVVGFILLMFSSFAAYSSAEDSHKHQSHHDQVTIDDEIAREAGIKTDQVQPGQIEQTLTAYGEVVYHPTQLSHVRARFNGIINQVTAHIGDTVQAGEVLAYIESNESLKSYPLKSPITGIVTDRHANAGELTQQQVLFTIANEKIRWVELKIFPGQQSQVANGQDVWINLPIAQSNFNQSFSDSGKTQNDNRVKAQIIHIVPSPQPKPYVVAHLKLADTKLNLHAGLMVSADIIVNKKPVKMRVKNQAIQTHEGHKVVFIKKGQSYIAQKISIGQQDKAFSEINSGLALGDIYVSQNSYLIKADLAKSSASHSH